MTSATLDSIMALLENMALYTTPGEASAMTGTSYSENNREACKRLNYNHHTFQICWISDILHMVRIEAYCVGYVQEMKLSNIQ